MNESELSTLALIKSKAILYYKKAIKRISLQERDRYITTISSQTGLEYDTVNYILHKYMMQVA